MKLAFSTLLLGAVLTSGAAFADRPALATFLEPNHVITLNYHQKFADELRASTNGEIDFELFVGGSLMPALSQMQGVSNGLAQAGIHATPYTPSELPKANAIGDMGFLVPDEIVLAYAYTDYMMHEQVGLDEWKGNGVVFGAGFANPTYYFLCNQDLRTLDDMQGKRVRTQGGAWARFVQSLGMVPVNIPSSEIYTGMERGALDCASADITHLIGGATILDLTKSVVLLPSQPAYGSPGLIFNRDWWQGLSAEQRRNVFDASAAAMAKIQVAFVAEVAKAIEAGKAKGIVFNEPDETLVAARDAFVADDVGRMSEVAADTYGVAEPTALQDRFKTYIDKWQGLLEGVDRTDEAALTALLKTNLFDTLDPNTYGVD